MVSAGATTFAYRSFATGSPVVFLNHFRATMDHWDPDFLNAVAQTRRVIVFDNAGVSLSAGQTPDTFAGMADDAARFVRALGIERADFVGWSTGGMAGQALLVRHPDVVRTAVLLATMPPGGTPEHFPPLSACGLPAQARSLGRSGRRVPGGAPARGQRQRAALLANRLRQCEAAASPRIPGLRGERGV